MTPPVVVQPAGVHLAAEIEGHHWSQSEFAEILGRPVQFVSEIIAGKKEITRESAAQIAAALDTSAELWLDLQNRYWLWRQEQDAGRNEQLDAVRRRARLNKIAPISLLRKRGAIKGETLDEVEREVMELFELPSLDDEASFATAARRTNTTEPLTQTQLAWLAWARRRARSLSAAPFDPQSLETLAASLTRRIASSGDFAAVQGLLADVGVRLVFVEAFPSSKINGASFVLDEEEAQPVIALSGRGRRLDIVLFTLLHEIAHIVNGDIRIDATLVDEGADHTLGDEDKANSLAQQWATPGGLSQPPLPLRQAWVEIEADRLGVHPLVVIGQLQKSGYLDWRTQLVKGAPTVSKELASWR